jgi:hypothetical protein
MIKNTLNLIITWIIEETSIVEMSFINLNWASFIAHHKLLERQEANVPSITLFISYVLRYSCWVLKLWTNLELPNASINFSITVEWSPVFKMLWFISRRWHLSDVRDHICIVYIVIHKLCFIVSVK